MIETVLQHWDSLFDVVNVILKIIRDYLAPRDTICYLLEKLDFLEELPYLLERAIDLKKNNNYDIFARNIISFFSEPGCPGSIDPKTIALSIGEAEFLLHNTIEYQDRTRVDCSDVIKFLKFYIGGLIYAEIPAWVSLLEGENLSLLKTVSPGLPHEEREVIGEKYMNKAKDLFFSIKDTDAIEGKHIDLDMQKALESFLSIMSVQNSKVVHNPNRIFGPLNAFKERNCVSSPGKEGPCRMLECRCRQTDVYHMQNFEHQDGFDGRCEQCLYQIRDRSHALRIPVEEGGWMGCYCSFKCLEEGISFKDSNSTIRLETMKYTLVVDGIMDRAML